MLSTVATILVFLVIIGLAISIHEFGHFLAAKISGIRVEEFAFGFGPKIFSKKYKGTEYVIKLFPIGGSVSILGEEESVDKKDSFSQKPYLVKVFVAIGGIIMNFILAAIVFYALLFHLNFSYASLPYYEDYNLPFGTESKMYAYPPTVLEILDGGGAEKAGLKPYDQIVKIDNIEVSNTEDLKKVLLENKSKTVDIEYVGEDGKKETVISINDEGKIGIAHAEDLELLKIEYRGYEKVFVGFTHSINMTKANFFLMGKIFSQAFKEKDAKIVTDSLSGPVGLLAITDIVKEYAGIWGLVELLGVLSIALVITNVVPFPGLDGSHVLFVTIEQLRGKPISEKTKKIIFGGGMIILLTLAFLIAVKDFVQFGMWDWVKGLFS